MKHKFVALTVAILLMLLCIPTVSAAGTLKATVSADTVPVGETVTVTLQYDAGSGIDSVKAIFRYNTAAFQYVSCDGLQFFTAAGDAGVIRLSGQTNMPDGPTRVAAVLTLKAIAPGQGEFSAETDEFISSADYSTLGAPAATLAVSAVNPSLSKNADLASLQPSVGALTPAFSPDVTTYRITVPHETQRLTLSAIPADKAAKVSHHGTTDLLVGENAQTLTVTAQSGATKTYTVTVIREAAGEPMPEPSATDPIPTVPQPTAPAPADGDSPDKPADHRPVGAVVLIALGALGALLIAALFAKPKKRKSRRKSRR